VNPWIAGARPKTLPAAVVPVAVGLAVAVGNEGVRWWLGLPALIVSLALQVGVNYANDYSDGIRGTDEQRVGPLRLVGSGAAPPSRVKQAAFLAFGAAGAAGLLLASVTTWWLLVIGAVAIASAWLYTGGPRPYGYAGLGEVFVFVFFGLVATAGTGYVVADSLTGTMLVSGSAAGCFACALLVINNLRDIPGDTDSGKRTLAVRLGDTRTRVLYVVLMVVPFVTVPFLCGLSARPIGALSMFAVLFARTPVQRVIEGARGPALIPVLGATGRVQLVFGVLLSVGLFVGG